MNMINSKFLLALMVASSWSFKAEAGFAEDWAKTLKVVPHGYVCHRATGPVTVDAKLDEPSWAAVPWTEDFRDIEAGNKPPPKFRTRAKMLWDDEYFYVAAELEEPHVWGTIMKHDAVIFEDNDFEVFIDPNGDTHDYYEFEMNALNTGWDLMLKKPYKDGGKGLNSWEIPGLKTAVHVRGTINNPADTDEGWTVEIAFPWKVLKEHAQRPAPPSEGDQWRVDFSRVEWAIEIVDGKYHKVKGRKEDNWIWSPIGVVDMHRPERWGYVQFTKLAPGTVSYVPDPAAATRNALLGIYYLQKDFQTNNHRWAGSLSELGWPGKAVSAEEKPSLKLVPNGFEAAADRKSSAGKIEHWHIRQDSLIWSD
jgi:hypothetical protein